jgi:hypothetical protein
MNDTKIDWMVVVPEMSRNEGSERLQQLTSNTEIQLMAMTAILAKGRRFLDIVFLASSSRPFLCCDEKTWRCHRALTGATHHLRQHSKRLQAIVRLDRITSIAWSVLSKPEASQIQQTVFHPQSL